MMKTLITGAVAAATLGGATLGAAGAANAQPYRGYHGYHGGGYRTGALVGAGLLGLAAGVALADRPHYGYAYGPAPYYGRPYGYRYAYGPACRTVWRFDPYIGRRVPVERCW